jgi:hypothetical protein
MKWVYSGREAQKFDFLREVELLGWHLQCAALSPSNSKYDFSVVGLVW